MGLGERIRAGLHAFTAPVQTMDKVVRSTQGEGRKDNPVGDLIIPFYEGQEIAPPEGYEELSIQGYRNAAVVRAVIGRIARATADIPIKLQRKGAEGEWEDLDTAEDDEHPLMRLISRPNPRQTKVDFLESVFAARMLAGESFVLPNGPGESMAPTELWWARPDKMRCIPGMNGMVKEWKYKVGRGEKTFDMDVPEGAMAPVHQWKTFNPLDEWRGLSILGSAKMQLCQVNEGARWNAQTLKNGARPSGAFVYKPDDKTGRAMGQDQRKQLEQDIEERVTGAKNAARPYILDAGLTWQEMSISPKDLEWLEGMRDASRVICFLLGYPPIMLGIPGDATYKNYAEARTSFYRDTAIPLLRALLGEWNEWLTPAFGDDLQLVVDEEKVEALSEERAQNWDRIEKSTILTINEKRKAIGRDPVDEPMADVILVASNVVPLSDMALPEEGELDENGDPIDPEADPQGDESEDSQKPLKPGKPGKPKVPMGKSYQKSMDRLLDLTKQLGEIAVKKD